MADVDGGRVAARQLRAAGIDTLFGVVAGPMIEVFAGAQAEGLRVVGCRHEESAGFMASAWGWARRRPGVLVVGSGPGMTNAVTPMYVATASAMPLVVLGGSAYSQTTGLGAFQEADQLAFAAPACKWTARVDRTERIGEWLHLALARARNGRPGAVYLDFPGEVVARRIPEERATTPSRKASPNPSGCGSARTSPSASSSRVGSTRASSRRSPGRRGGRRPRPSPSPVPVTPRTSPATPGASPRISVRITSRSPSGRARSSAPPRTSSIGASTSRTRTTPRSRPRSSRDGRARPCASS